jgi:DNA invertase Pin-like site-specific DNA recombinase
MLKPKLSAAIYTRTNHENQTGVECRRTQDQIELCLSVARSQGFSKDKIHIYSDQGVSGVNKLAPELEKLLVVVLDYSAVFVPDMSRISRDYICLSKVIRQISDSGAALWTCNPDEQHLEAINSVLTRAQQSTPESSIKITIRRTINIPFSVKSTLNRQ